LRGATTTSDSRPRPDAFQKNSSPPASACIRVVSSPRRSRAAASSPAIASRSATSRFSRSMSSA